MIQLGGKYYTILSLSLNTEETSWTNLNVFKWNLQYSAYRQMSDKFPIQNGLKEGDALSP
jgi:hypothetical protein